jgi:hypothetical protein
MMFIVRSAGDKPDTAEVRIKAARNTPGLVPDGLGKTDYFCVGAPEAIAALRGAGWEVVELGDGWYEDETGGGVAISGQGRYWEVRDTHFTVAEAVGPSDGSAASAADGDQVNVRGAIFGV